MSFSVDSMLSTELMEGLGEVLAGTVVVEAEAAAVFAATLAADSSSFAAT